MRTIADGRLCDEIADKLDWPVAPDAQERIIRGVQGVPSASTAVTSLRVCSRPWLIGVLHLPALPGAPGAAIPIEDVARHAFEDALILQDLGFTDLMVENITMFHFLPATQPPKPSLRWSSRRELSAKPPESLSGSHGFRNGALASLRVTVASHANLLEVSVLTRATITDQRLIQDQADVLLRRREALEADLMILANVESQHATSQNRCSHSQRPVGSAPALTTSGITPDTLRATLNGCAGTFVGSALRRDESDRIEWIRSATYAERITR